MKNPAKHFYLAVGKLAHEGGYFMKDSEAITRVHRGVARLGLDWADIIGPVRRRQLVDARKMVSYFLREQGWTFKDIGEVMNRDHATAMHHTRTLFHLMENEKETRRRYIDFCSA
jgi:chromosomal replication initiation ATPase DnaA